jgi:hypothetical protein
MSGSVPALSATKCQKEHQAKDQKRSGHLEKARFVHFTFPCEGLGYCQALRTRSGVLVDLRDAIRRPRNS